MIRSKAVPPKAAMQSLKIRIASKNGRVQMSALGVSQILGLAAVDSSGDGEPALGGLA